jgi:adenine phosphoribosyltransferase
MDITDDTGELPSYLESYFQEHIRTVPDWPAPGVQFRDITPLLQTPKVFRVCASLYGSRAQT